MLKYPTKKIICDFVSATFDLLQGYCKLEYNVFSILNDLSEALVYLHCIQLLSFLFCYLGKGVISTVIGVYFCIILYLTFCIAMNG